jgi:hypothetical protein
VEFWFNFNNSNETSIQATDWSFIFTWNDSSINAYRNDTGASVPAGIHAVGVAKLDGYSLELRFSWPGINSSTPTPGNTLSGINVQVDHPSSVGEALNRCLIWSASNNNSPPGTISPTSSAGPTPTPTPTPPACGTPACTVSWTFLNRHRQRLPHRQRGPSDRREHLAGHGHGIQLQAESRCALHGPIQPLLLFGSNGAGVAGIAFVMHNAPLRALTAQVTMTRA